MACLVLDASDQEKVEAAKDGVKLIKAANQPGISPGNEKLLSLHNNFPFQVDLVVGHGTDSGAAAAILAQRLECCLLHVFHNLPVEDEGYEEGSMAEERDVALNADFVAGVGPLVVDKWSMIINRQVHMIIPGMPKVLPRNKIRTPQSRCLILGIMDNLTMGGLDLATGALADCRQQENPIHLTVLGAHQEKVHELQERIKKQCHSSVLRPVVKPFDVSQEIVEVEIRGVSLVLMPSPSDGFGMLALEALSANVPVLISSSSGLAMFLQQEFGRSFLKFLSTSKDTKYCIDEWSNAIDDILEDRDKSFTMAASLRDQWNSKFTWDSTTNDLLSHLARTGNFSVQSPLAAQDIILPSQCSDSALAFMEEEVDLLNRRRKHVLFVSPENASISPFIRYFAQVPWIAVFDFDVNSVATGYLASCESFCENMGIKICRMLPPLPDEDGEKISVTLPNGMPWVLLEGIPESKRNVKKNLVWIREFFMAVRKNYPGPITFLVVWRSVEETKVLCKTLTKILTGVQCSSLERQVKVAIASTAPTEDGALEDIAEEWNAEIHKFGLEDICNALHQCVSSSRFIQQNQEFALPVADPDDPQQVSFKVLPPNRRWINAEMEVLYQSVGSTPQFESDDASHFYRGGLISWYALQMGCAVERGNWKALDARIQEVLQKAGTMKLKMPHQRGAGGTTTARKILFDYHEKYPCVFLESVNRAEIAPAIKVLTEFCRLPVIILVDRKDIQSDEFDVDSLYNSLSNDRIPCVILEVIHQSQQRERGFSEKFEKTTPVRLADTLTYDEAHEFVMIYSTQNKEKRAALHSLLNSRQMELQIPFYYALLTFEDLFTGLEPFVKECLQDLGPKERDVLLFLAMTYHYGHSSLAANDFARLLQAPRREVLSLKSVLPDLSRELLSEEDGKWRPRHDLIALEMLRQLLTMPGDDGVANIHPDNWRNQLADKAIICFTHMPEAVVCDMLLSRGTDDNSHQNFSQLISDIPLEEDAIRLFENAISLFPDNPFFKVHLGRFYSIQKKSAGFVLATKYTNEGIRCADVYPSRVVRGQFAQMKGVVYSREVQYLSEANEEITTIIEMADEAVKNFRRAVSIAPDLVDGYIPEVRMMCKLFEHIDRTTGSFHDYVKSQDAHRFIIDAFSNTLDTLECVSDSDEYSYWRMRLACVGRRWFSPEKFQETLNLLLHLRRSDRASRGSINRQIVIMTMIAQSRKGQPIAEIAPDLIKLLNEALIYDSNVEQTMRLWVRLAPFISVNLSESEDKIFHWCLKEKSVRSYLYKYIVACLHLLGGGSRSYSEIMKNAKDDLNSAIKAMSRSDVGRCRHPDRPVVWLGHEASGMGNLVYLDEKISELIDVRMKRFIASKYTNQLRPLTGRIVTTGNKVGVIRINGELDVSFRADLCETPLKGSNFVNRKVRFFLAFTFFGTDAYNVQVVAETPDRNYLA